GIGMIQVMNHEDAQTLPGHQFEVDFLLPPLTRFEVLSRVSTALRHSETLSSLESSTQTDEVTQLYNRTYFLKRLAGEIALSKRHESPVCCVVLGINYYQVFLDSYGYEFINGLLKHLAVIIKSHIRQEDMVARVGDEELALLLPRSSEKGAQVMTERIIRSVLELPFEFEEQTEEITLHAGIAGYPMIEESDTQEADADALIRYARHALHNAKSSESRTIQCFGEIKPAFG
nr:GGDEF domain-containing protein [Vampirovibrio sp.]